MRRHATLFLLLIAAGVAMGALSAWALAPVVEVVGGGGGKKDNGGNDAVFVVVADDEATTTTSTPLLSLPREDPLDKRSKKKRETCPVANLAAQCPPHKRDIHFKNENYTMRTYYGGDWATTMVHSSRLELAAAKGYGTLSRYFNGNNDDNERMPSTAPLVTGFVLNDTTTGSDFVVSAWIPEDYQNDAPRPFDDQEIAVKYFGRETYFVGNWTSGPATAGAVVAKAKELIDALDRNKEKYRKETAWLMSYSPMSQLTGRYYEIAFKKKEKEN